MNHSDEPNCDDPQGEITVTNRIIRAGEELTSDYRNFDWASRMRGMTFELAATGSSIEAQVKGRTSGR